MVSEKCPVVRSDQYAENNWSPNTLHLSPSPSMISKRQLPVSSIWNSEVHTVRLGDLFQERLKTIHTTISKSPDKLLETWIDYMPEATPLSIGCRPSLQKRVKNKNKMLWRKMHSINSCTPLVRHRWVIRNLFLDHYLKLACFNWPKAFPHSLFLYFSQTCLG